MLAEQRDRANGNPIRAHNDRGIAQRVAEIGVAGADLLGYIDPAPCGLDRHSEIVGFEIAPLARHMKKE